MVLKFTIQEDPFLKRTTVCSLGLKLLHKVDGYKKKILAYICIPDFKKQPALKHFSPNPKHFETTTLFPLNVIGYFCIFQAIFSLCIQCKQGQKKVSFPIFNILSLYVLFIEVLPFLYLKLHSFN